ncbi:hypothetical protein ACHAXT_012535 [Thalassiosira profunda]
MGTRARRPRPRSPGLGPPARRWIVATVLLASGGRVFEQQHQRTSIVAIPAVQGFSPSSRPSSRRLLPCSEHFPLSAVASSSAADAIDAAAVDFYDRLDGLYDKAQGIKCPFFRRRAADVIDGAAMMMRFLLIRHKSLPLVSDLFLGDGETSAFSAPGCKPLGRHVQRHADGSVRKARGLPLAEVARRLGTDWTGGTAGEDRGYYITGRLDSTIYRDDCLFVGPDPDMPVRGLRKYLSAAAHLFDPRESRAELLSIRAHERGGEKGRGMVEATWRLGGVLMLPWHPTVEPWTGTTRYHLDEEGLVYLHEERWDISVWRAFLVTLFPEAKDWRIWDLERISVHL